MQSNRDYLAFFHKLHCILRDGEIGLTGLNALNEINNMILIVFMEQFIDKYNLNENIKFSYIYNKYVIAYLHEKHQSEKNEKIDKIITKYNNILMTLYQNKETNMYIFSDTNKLSAFHSISTQSLNIDNNTYFGAGKQLIELFIACYDFFYGTDNKKETKITKEQVKLVLDNIQYDILGDTYEKFKEDEVGNQGKNSGQYFTPRIAIKYIIEHLIKPNYTELCYDSSCETGGFIHYLNKYIHINYTKEQHDKFKLNIYGNDKTTELIKPLYINLFLHDIPVKNILNKNSLSVENCWNNFEKFDCIVGNPPFGMSIKSNPNDYINKNKINYFPKFMISAKDKTITDSMGQFMIHTINSIKVGGRFSLVIDRGILNNGTENKSWQKSLRQWLLTLCDIQTIILLPKGIFTHTMFDTAIIYGIKKLGYIETYKILPNPSTTNIKIYEAEINSNELIVENLKIELSIEDIVNKDWSLNYDNYILKVENLYNCIEYKKLGEICEFKNIKSEKEEICTDNGKYPYYSSSIIKYNLTDIYNDDDNVLIINKVNGTGKNKVFHNIGKYSISSAVMVFKPIKLLNIKYLHLYLIIKNLDISNLFTGGDKKSLKLSSFKELKVPIIQQEHQERIVKILDEYIDNNYKVLDRLVEEFKDIDLFKFLLYEDYDTIKMAIKIAYDLLSYDKRDKEAFNIRRKWCFKMFKSEEKKLGDLCEFEFGTRITKTNDSIEHIENYNGPKYPVYGGGGITFETNKYNRESNTLIISRFGVSPKCVRIVNNKYFLNDSGMTINNYKINKKYLDYYLLINQNKIYEYACGQAQKNMQTNKLFRDFKVLVPSLEDQEKIFSMIDEINNEENDFHKNIQSIKENIKRMYVCVEYIVDKTNYNNDNNYDNDDEDNNDDNDNNELED